MAVLRASLVSVFTLVLGPRTSASKSSIRRFVITEKAPTTAFTFKTLLRHYAKQAMTVSTTPLLFQCYYLKVVKK